MRVVVTGASGFIGNALVRLLQKQGVDVLALSRRRMPGVAQLRDFSVSPAADVLIHLAQESDRRKVNEAGEAGVLAAQVTLKALLTKPFGRIVYASSAVLYGDTTMSPHSPSDSIYAEDTYAGLKRQSEVRVLETGRGVVARLSNVYGPNMAPGNVVSKILGQIPGEGAIEVMDDAPVRDFLWIEDAAAGLATIAVGEKAGIYNLGTGMGTSIGNLARLALDVAGQPGRAIKATRPSQGLSHLVLDIRETTSHWGWRPEITLREGLKRLLAIKQAQA